MTDTTGKKVHFNTVCEEIPQAPFAEDADSVKQAKTYNSKLVNGKKLCMNQMSESSFEDAPTISVKKEDYEFLLDTLENFNKNKVKRAEIQRRYFENHKGEYYARQKKWRDQNRIRINASRRDKYSSGMVTVGEIESMPEEKIIDDGMLLAEQINDSGDIIPITDIQPGAPQIEELSSSGTSPH